MRDDKQGGNWRVRTRTAVGSTTQITFFKVELVEVHPRDELAASLRLKTRHFFHAQFAVRERGRSYVYSRARFVMWTTHTHTHYTHARAHTHTHILTNIH